MLVAQPDFDFDSDFDLFADTPLYTPWNSRYVIRNNRREGKART